MAKPLALWLALFSGFPFLQARAGEQICRQEDVVNFVSRAIGQEYAYVKIKRDRIFERPAPAAGSVLCFAEVVRSEYDYIRYERMLWADTKEYLVRKLAHGYEVTILR